MYELILKNAYLHCKNFQVMCNNGGLVDIPIKYLPPTVEQLSLSKNDFPVIRSEAFAGLRALKRLSMDGNAISALRPFAFRGLPRLKELSIQHSTLDTIAQFTFAGLQNITSILLGHNRIKRIEGYAFAGTSNIKHLRLNNNPMQTIETNAFSGLSNVDHLVFPSGIKNIEIDAFSGLVSVNTIKLAFMDLSTMKRYTFRGLLHVNVLSIQESDLGVLEYGAFEGLSYVGLLNMFNNKIDAIREFNVSYNNSVKAIRFHGNHLLENPNPEAVIIEGVTRLVVTANHFPCDCKARGIADGPLGNATSGDFLERNFCISPMEVRGRRMKDMEKDFSKGCDAKIVSGQGPGELAAKASHVSARSLLFSIILINVTLTLFYS